jgi:hypothetical protein
MNDVKDRKSSDIDKINLELLKYVSLQIKLRVLDLFKFLLDDLSDTW